MANSDVYFMIAAISSEPEPEVANPVTPPPAVAAPVAPDTAPEPEHEREPTPPPHTRMNL